MKKAIIQHDHPERSVLNLLFGEAGQMSKPDEMSKSGAALRSLIFALAVATAFYYLDPCGCNLVARHVQWLVGVVGKAPVCIVAVAIAFLVRKWITDHPWDAVGAAVLLAPPVACGALAYWLTNSSLVAALSGVEALALIVLWMGRKAPPPSTGGRAQASYP
jgi:hypothetical protein